MAKSIPKPDFDVVREVEAEVGRRSGLTDGEEKISQSAAKQHLQIFHAFLRWLLASSGVTFTAAATSVLTWESSPPEDCGELSPIEYLKHLLADEEGKAFASYAKLRKSQLSEASYRTQVCTLRGVIKILRGLGYANFDEQMLDTPAAERAKRSIPWVEQFIGGDGTSDSARGYQATRRWRMMHLVEFLRERLPEDEEAEDDDDAAERLAKRELEAVAAIEKATVAGNLDEAKTDLCLATVSGQIAFCLDVEMPLFLKGLRDVISGKHIVSDIRLFVAYLAEQGFCNYDSDKIETPGHLLITRARPARGSKGGKPAAPEPEGDELNDDEGEAPDGDSSDTTADVPSDDAGDEKSAGKKSAKKSARGKKSTRKKKSPRKKKRATPKAKREKPVVIPPPYTRLAERRVLGSRDLTNWRPLRDARNRAIEAVVCEVEGAGLSEACFLRREGVGERELVIETWLPQEKFHEVKLPISESVASCLASYIEIVSSSVFSDLWNFARAPFFFARDGGNLTCDDRDTLKEFSAPMFFSRNNFATYLMREHGLSFLQIVALRRAHLTGHRSYTLEAPKLEVPRTALGERGDKIALMWLQSARTHNLSGHWTQMEQQTALFLAADGDELVC